MTKLGHVISLAEVAPYPAGRTLDDGPYSGQFFRDTYLVPALKEGLVNVRLDHAAGLPISFLEEAFGGLIRIGFSEDELKRKLTIQTNQDRLERYIAMIWDFIRKASLIKEGRIA